MGQSLEINVLKVYGSARREIYGFQQQFPTPCIKEVIKLALLMFKKARKPVLPLTQFETKKKRIKLSKSNLDHGEVQSTRISF